MAANAIGINNPNTHIPKKRINPIYRLWLKPKVWKADLKPWIRWKANAPIAIIYNTTKPMFSNANSTCLYKSFALVISLPFST